MTTGDVVSGGVYTTLSVFVDEFPLVSKAVMVITFVPSARLILAILQLTVPEANPFPPLELIHVRLLTPELSEAVPEIVTAGLLVE